MRRDDGRGARGRCGADGDGGLALLEAGDRTERRAGERVDVEAHDADVGDRVDADDLRLDALARVEHGLDAGGAGHQVGAREDVAVVAEHDARADGRTLGPHHLDPDDGGHGVVRRPRPDRGRRPRRPPPRGRRGRCPGRRRRWRAARPPRRPRRRRPRRPRCPTGAVAGRATPAGRRGGGAAGPAARPDGRPAGGAAVRPAEWERPVGPAPTGDATGGRRAATAGRSPLRRRRRHRSSRGEISDHSRDFGRALPVLFLPVPRSSYHERRAVP